MHPDQNQRKKPDWSAKTPEEWNRHQRKKKLARLRKARLSQEAKKHLIHNAGVQLAARGTTTQRGVFTSTGVREHDIWRPEDHEVAPAERVGDERRDKIFCRRCKAEVDVRQEGPVWLTYDPDGRPHHETCKNPAPPPEDW